MRHTIVKDNDQTNIRASVISVEDWQELLNVLVQKYNELPDTRARIEFYKPQPGDDK